MRRMPPFEAKRVNNYFKTFEAFECATITKERKRTLPGETKARSG